jgi:hypothetical protein
MKKNEAKKLKKLQLSRETLRTLTGVEAQMVVGGHGTSCQSACPCCDTVASEDVCGTS